MGEFFTVCKFDANSKTLILADGKKILLDPENNKLYFVSNDGKPSCAYDMKIYAAQGNIWLLSINGEYYLRDGMDGKDELNGPFQSFNKPFFNTFTMNHANGENWIIDGEFNVRKFKYGEIGKTSKISTNDGLLRSFKAEESNDVKIFAMTQKTDNEKFAIRFHSGLFSNEYDNIIDKDGYCIGIRNGEKYYIDPACNETKSKTKLITQMFDLLSKKISLDEFDISFLKNEKVYRHLKSYTIFKNLGTEMIDCPHFYNFTSTGRKFYMETAESKKFLEELDVKRRLAMRMESSALNVKDIKE